VAESTRIRREQPTKKILFGNSSFNIIDEFLYRKFPADLFDAVGHEACGLMRMPERQPELASLQEVYWFRQVLQAYGHQKDIWSTHEWTYHSTNPGNHTLQTQADLYVRDMLRALAYDFKRITPAGLEDVGNGYHWSNWGASGLFTRYPDVHPKPSYSAYATAAHELSDADFIRAVPTGSHSVYCLEFSRRRGDKLLACWTLRGTRPLSLSVKPAGRAHLTDQQGNTERLESKRGWITFGISPSPVFVHGTAECGEAKAGPPARQAELSYLRRLEGRSKELSALDSLDGWQLPDKPDDRLDNGNFDMPRQKGTYEVIVVNDEARGKCLQFSLAALGGWPGWIPAYQVLSSLQPIAVPGRLTAIGLYVKGNSGWGRIHLELRDAKGEGWLSIGMPGAWNASDEQSVSYVIFDGWSWMEIPLPGHYGSGFHWPRYCNWRHDGGDGIVHYPLALTAIVVEQRRKIVYVNETMDASREPVRLSGLTALCGNPEEVGDWEERR